MLINDLQTAINYNSTRDHDHDFNLVDVDVSVDHSSSMASCVVPKAPVNVSDVASAGLRLDLSSGGCWMD